MTFRERFEVSKRIAFALLKSVLNNAAIQSLYVSSDFAQRTWKFSEWNCMQNEDSLGLLLGLKIIHSLCFA